MPEPMPCPWCGEKPECHRNDRGTYTVTCMNLDCLVSPSLSRWAIKERAILFWNNQRGVAERVMQAIRDARKGMILEGRAQQEKADAAKTERDECCERFREFAALQKVESLVVDNVINAVIASREGASDE